jgi:hypothetical protein
MRPATHVNFIWSRLGKTLGDVRPAETLFEEMAGLTQYVRNVMQENQGSFNFIAELEGFAPTRLRFQPLCQTVALVLLHPHAPKSKVPDAVCLLVNGLEGPVDIATVKANVTFPPELWQTLHESKKPVVVAAFNVNGRLRDPAAITVINVIGNVYFNMFGTNAVDGEI